MAGMGPPPKDPARRARTNATVAMTMLPAGGRRGAAPGWPLPADPRATAQLELARERAGQLQDAWAAASNARTARALAKRLEALQLAIREQELVVKARDDMELALWRELWRKPQAVQWQRQGSHRSVAMYVRHEVLGELGDLDHSREARLRAELLGLTPMSMLRLRWSIALDEVAEKRAEKTATPTGARARRGPLRSVAPKVAGDD